MSAGGRSVASLLLAIWLSGCAILPLGTRANTALTPDTTATRGTMQLALKDPPNIFVGIAMSGGGSRAANFSAAVLFELQELGFLEHVSALSSVSGSSLTAAYYGLFGHDPELWNPERVKDLLRKDFQARWIWRWFLPHNIVRYWLTDFDRSDIMKGVFDDVLFGGKTFGGMPPAGPKILINATSLSTGQRFVFTDEAFRDLRSRLDRYPVSHAVMASGAFPGAFQNVTLQDYSEQRSYEHLFDGGPTDNLGVETLLKTGQNVFLKLPPTSRGHFGCFLFIVDAYPLEFGKGRQERDTRKAFDFILDDNIQDASDVLLSRRREDILGRVGFPLSYIGLEPYREFPLFQEIKDGPLCAAWHFTFPSLLYRSDLPPEAPEIGKIVTQIKTRYHLTAPGVHTAQGLQNSLYRAARILVAEDKVGLTQTCTWFGKHGLTNLRGCREAGSDR